MDADDNVKNDAQTKTVTVKDIRETFEKQRSLQNGDQERQPIYTKEKEEKLLEKYQSISKTKLDKYVKFFKEADTENLGFLTIHQFAEVVRKRGFTGKDSEITDMFVDINKNLDWEMTLEEFLNEMARQDAKTRTEAEMLEIFRKFDFDKDGYISKEELKKTVQKCRPKSGLDIDLDEVMKRSDKDGDGKLSFEDFMKSCKYRDNGKEKK